MSTAIEEWSRRQGRIKIAQLVAEGFESLKSELGQDADV
jgi:hypothetical protein